MINKHKNYIKIDMKYIITIAIICFSFFAHSQNEVRLLDLTITPVFNVSDSVPSDSTDYNVSFKIKNIINVTQANLKLGSADQLSDVKEFTMGVFQSEGKSYISYNGQQFEVVGYSANCIIRMANTDVQSTLVFTLQAIDTQGISTYSYLNNITQ
tara:strand:+ start:364 stop:828 length:465 start_codon:yes stop_codon:yes gene_type:complete